MRVNVIQMYTSYYVQKDVFFLQIGRKKLITMMNFALL